MKMNKTKVYHINNGHVGGVSSVIANIVRFSSSMLIENHIIYTINKDVYNTGTISKIEGAITEFFFYYSAKWNFYYTCKQLAKLLPDDRAVLVAHDWLGLGMASNLGLQNPLVHFVHGNYNYYYELAKKNESSTDSYIAVSPVICDKLTAMFPGRKADIHYCRFPVPRMQAANKGNQILKIVYCVRSLIDENKQFKLLPLIVKELASKGLKVDWTIIGDGLEKQHVEKLMDQKTGITFFSSLLNEEVLKIMPEHDLFILPSIQEGFPVTVVEAMKAGVVPLVTNWDGATEELIIQNETGYYFEPGDAEGYADIIFLLNTDRELLKKIANNGITKSKYLFDPYTNTKDIEDVLLNAAKQEKKVKRRFKVYGSRLDNVLIPNKAVKIIRRLRSLKF